MKTKNLAVSQRLFIKSHACRVVQVVISFNHSNLIWFIDYPLLISDLSLCDVNRRFAIRAINPTKNDRTGYFIAPWMLGCWRCFKLDKKNHFFPSSASLR